jgi:hypothetical protein
MSSTEGKCEALCLINLLAPTDRKGPKGGGGWSSLSTACGCKHLKRVVGDGRSHCSCTSSYPPQTVVKATRVVYRGRSCTKHRRKVVGVEVPAQDEEVSPHKFLRPCAPFAACFLHLPRARLFSGQ